MKINKGELDRHITGNYGEDQFEDENIDLLEMLEKPLSEQEVRLLCEERWQDIKMLLIGHTQLKADNAALQTKLEVVIDSCEWWHDEDSDIWMTSCGGTWVFTNDGPKENECHYCMYCGRGIEALEAGSNG